MLLIDNKAFVIYSCLLSLFVSDHELIYTPLFPADRSARKSKPPKPLSLCLKSSNKIKTTCPKTKPLRLHATPAWQTPQHVPPFLKHVPLHLHTHLLFINLSLTHINSSLSLSLSLSHTHTHTSPLIRHRLIYQSSSKNGGVPTTTGPTKPGPTSCQGNHGSHCRWVLPNPLRFDPSCYSHCLDHSNPTVRDIQSDSCPCGHYSSAYFHGVLSFRWVRCCGTDGSVMDL